jgi:hypothetical protein
MVFISRTEDGNGYKAKKEYRMILTVVGTGNLTTYICS